MDINCVTDRISEADFKRLKELDYVCPICDRILTDPVETSCGHLFCLHCLLPALKATKDKCPSCNTLIPLGDEERKFTTIGDNRFRISKFIERRIQARKSSRKNSCMGMRFEPH